MYDILLYPIVAILRPGFNSDFFSDFATFVKFWAKTAFTIAEYVSNTLIQLMGTIKTARNERITKHPLADVTNRC